MEIQYLVNEGHHARTYHKGAWAVLNDRGAVNKIFKKDENYVNGDYKQL